MNYSLIYKNENIGKMKIQGNVSLLNKAIICKRKIYIITSIRKTLQKGTIEVIDLKQYFDEFKKEIIIKIVDGENRTLDELEKIQNKLEGNKE